jgi:hypothetical protein
LGNWRLEALERIIGEFKELSKELPESDLAQSEINSFQAWLSGMRGNWLDALTVIRQLRVESHQRGYLQNVLNHDYGLAYCFREHTVSVTKWTLAK